MTKKHKKVLAIPDEFGQLDPKGMPPHFFAGARRVDYGARQRAETTKQHFAVCPRFWYVDATFACCECGEEFMFAASEQRFWYEVLQFFVDSLPKRCVLCRKSERTRTDLRKRYDVLIKGALGQCAVETKKKVVEAINELEVAEGQISDEMAQNRVKLHQQIAQAA